MSDEQLHETSISQGHTPFGICDGICIFMCEYGNLILKQCSQIFFLVTLVQKKNKNLKSIVMPSIQQHILNASLSMTHGTGLLKGQHF